MITFAETKEIVRAAEEVTWTVGTYQIEDDGWEDATHYWWCAAPQKPWATVQTRIW
jgi:hypothetical protein